MTVLSIPDRKRREQERRRAAAATVMIRLHDYARRHGGCFTVFGSAARNEMRHDSDIDILFRFPSERRAAAWTFAEELCGEWNLPADIQPEEEAGSRLLDRIASHRIVLA